MLMRFKTIIAALFAAFVTSPAAAQAFVDLDSEEFEEHRITQAELLWMEMLAMRLDSVLREEPKALQQTRIDRRHAIPLDSAGRMLEASPVLGAELARAGVSGREFVVMAWALVKAALTAEFQPDVAPGAAVSVASANVRLVRSNQKRIDRMMAVLRRIEPD